MCTELEKPALVPVSVVPVSVVPLSVVPVSVVPVSVVLENVHGTSKCGTGTKSALVLHSLGVLVPLYLVLVPLLHCMWVLIPVSVVLVVLPPKLLIFTIARLGASRK